MDRFFLRLGTLGFGRPIALSAAMQRDLVEERRWIIPEEYKEGLASAPCVARVYYPWPMTLIAQSPCASRAALAPS